MPLPACGFGYLTAAIASIIGRWSAIGSWPSDDGRWTAPCFASSLPDPRAIGYRAVIRHIQRIGAKIVTDAIETYDFIVTGAGSAGCAVAGRLSESGQLSRAAAGSRRAGQQSVDPHSARLHQDVYRPAGQLDVRQRARAGAQRPHPLPAARQGAGRHQLDQRHGLHARHPDRLRRLAPDAAAKAGTTTTCCRSSRRPRTRSAAPTSSTASAARCTCRTRCAAPLGDAMVQAAIEAGIPANPDFNGARQEGVGYYQTTTTNRRRWSSARAYLGAAKRPRRT